MRKFLVFLFLMPAVLFAQSRFGYYSGICVYEALPQYKKAKSDYELLRQRCEKETDRNEKELTRLYVDYLNGQRDFPEPILRKRQSELQRHVDSNVIFRQELRKWMAEAKDSLFAPSRKAVADALARVCLECNLDYAIDADKSVYGYINPQKGYDVTRMVIDAALHPDKPVNELDGYKEFAVACNLVTLRTSTEKSGDDEVTVVENE